MKVPWSLRSAALATWHARRWFGALGLPGLLAVALLLAALALYGIVRPRWQAEVAALTATIAELERDRSRLTAAVSSADPRMQMHARFAGLPATSSTAEIEAIERLHEAARSAQLDLEVGGYRLEQPDGQAVARLDVVVQARGSYPQLRAFAVRALQGDSALALSAVRLWRGGTGEAVVAAEFGFSLFMRVP